MSEPFGVTARRGDAIEWNGVWWTPVSLEEEAAFRAQQAWRRVTSAKERSGTRLDCDGRVYRPIEYDGRVYYHTEEVR